jgi:pimeloyl-ACP methyl ester carboxylesterase
MREVLVRVLSETYEDQMAAVSCPVQLLWGADDREVPVEVAERARPMFSAAGLTVLPGVGHMVPIEAPEAVREAITRLL